MVSIRAPDWNWQALGQLAIDRRGGRRRRRTRHRGWTPAPRHAAVRPGGDVDDASKPVDRAGATKMSPDPARPIWGTTCLTRNRNRLPYAKTSTSIARDARRPCARGRALSDRVAARPASARRRRSLSRGVATEAPGRAEVVLRQPHARFGATVRSESTRRRRRSTSHRQHAVHRRQSRAAQRRLGRLLPERDRRPPHARRSGPSCVRAVSRIDELNVSPTTNDAVMIAVPMSDPATISSASPLRRPMFRSASRRKLG